MSSKNGFVIIFLLFLLLKLTHAINWSWFWVTSPLWIMLSLLIIEFILALASEIVKTILDLFKW